MQKKKVKKQLILGFVLFGISIISGSFQIIFSSFNFVKVLSLVVVIGSSVCVGALIREFFILKET
ncbi:hypothetical protein P6709_05970 [Jeotgalibacillus sp. ET6]|uniref:hypothetical protein n=1 Tax=Jeotgalibacillus sp. ET6 TaxID=3037260 RepID=UPI0024182A03|nr:hypothetical protein [Jeotgalibacillus sp. ET6]MDG5471287.1 hypothetical protein [Jeotgalibacillus sp. ET6]